MRLGMKTIGLVVTALAVSLALGMWIHGQVILAIAAWRGEEEAWARLEAQGKKLVPQLRRLPWNETPDGESRPLERLRAAQQGIAPADRPGVVIVDAEWRVVRAVDSTDKGTGVRWSRGVPIDWKASNRKNVSPSRTGQPLYGTVGTPAGPRSALAWPLEDHDGYAVVYEPSRSGQAEISAESLWGVGAISFVWILGLQCIALYLIVTRVRSSTTDARQPTSEKLMLRRTQDLVRTRDAIIFGLAKLAESRDRETGHHLERIAMYSTRLAAALRTHPEFRHVVTPSFVRLIGISSALHDIGKVGIDDAILRKPGHLTPEERIRMHAHTKNGADCLSQIEQRLGSSNFLYMAREIALNHHEHWDGNGYPRGIAGEGIPLSARIVAIADVYDALSSKRVYKDPFPHEECVEIIRGQAGKQFDPRLVAVFEEIAEQFRQIALRYPDTRSAPSPARSTPKDNGQGQDKHEPTSGSEIDEELPWRMPVEPLSEEEYLVGFCAAQGELGRRAPDDLVSQPGKRV